MDLVNAKHRPREATYELTTIEGGWVTVRRFSHEERLDRASIIMTVSAGEKDDGEFQGQAQINHKAARVHDFKSCIVDHNLGDGNKKYNFKNPRDIWDLDAEVGDEIDDLISQHQEVVEEKDIPKSSENSNDTT